MKRSMFKMATAIIASAAMLTSVAAGSARKVAHFGSWPSMAR